MDSGLGKKNLNDYRAPVDSTEVSSEVVLVLENGGHSEGLRPPSPVTPTNGNSVAQTPSAAYPNPAGVAIAGPSSLKPAPTPASVNSTNPSYYRQRPTVPGPSTSASSKRKASVPSLQTLPVPDPATASAFSGVRDSARDAEISRLTSRKRLRTEEDNAFRDAAKARFSKALEADHQFVLRPDIETAFVDAADVVRRLLPYHIFQHPQGELDFALSTARTPKQSSAKGKEKGGELSNEELKELEDFNLALDLHKQKRALETRFRAIRTRSAKDSNPLDQLYWITQASLESDREYNVELSNELRDARMEHERKEREKQLAVQPPRRTGTSTPATPHPSYSYSTPIQNSYNPMTVYTSPAYQSYYQSYLASMANLTPAEVQTRMALYSQGRMPYAQGVQAATSYPYANYFAQSYTPLTNPVTPAPTSAPNTALSAPTSTAPSASVTPTVPSSSPIDAPAPAPSAPDTPFPISIPASALNTLHQLGIYPVATTSLPPNAPEPAAVFVGLSPDGSLINMTINLSKLEPTQRNGLAKFLSGLVKNEKPQPAAR